MLSSIHLKNFQGHKNTFVEFKKGVNTIIGSSDSGKSSVLRGLLWVMTNRPLGDSFRSHWAEKDETLVEIIWDDHTIRRTKTKTSNTYTLDDETYKAMGTDVPEPILQVLNMSELNTQKQMDSPFLLSMPSPDIAKLLNKITNLNIIDKAFANMNSMVNTNRSLEKQLLQEEKKYKDTLKQYEGIEDLNNKANAIKKEVDDLYSKKESHEDLYDAIQKIQTCSIKIRDLSKVEMMYKEIKNKATKILEIEKTPNNICSLIERIKTHTRLKKSTTKLTNQTKTLQKIREQIQEVNEKQNDIKQLSKKINEIKETKEKLSTHQKIVSDLEKSIYSISPNICPLCGNKIKDTIHETEPKKSRK